MIRRPPRSTRVRSSAASDVYKRQTYILDLQLRRLTKFSRVELETEKDELERQIEALRAMLGDEKLLLRTVSNELADVAKAHGTPRRTVLLESAGTPITMSTPLEVTDDPCWVLMSSTGLLARTTNAEAPSSNGGRHRHDAVIAAVQTTVPVSYTHLRAHET